MPSASLRIKVGQRGWLTALLEQAVADHVPFPLPEDWAPLSARARARAHLRQLLQESGLRYGTPAAGAQLEGTTSPEERLFLAVLRSLAALALNTADLVEAPKAKREEQLLILFAAMAGDREAAKLLDGKLTKKEPVPAKLVQRVEQALEQRAISLAGDPVYGLMLHNGAVYVDAQLLGHQAADYFVSGRFSTRRARRRAELAARMKALLVEVLAALACVERPPSFPARRAILRQIEDLKLPDAATAQVRTRVKGFFDKRPSLTQVVRGVRSEDARRFILEQTILASLVDGHRSQEELAFIQELGKVLRFTPEEVKAVELALAEFYATNRSLVDVFTVTRGAEVMGEELVKGMQRSLEKNFYRLMREIRETGELSVLLAQAARGKKLSSEEKRKVREQLIDIAKAIPALAIFAAPGGLLLLIALAKILPFSLLPSAFQDDEPTQTGIVPAARRR